MAQVTNGWVVPLTDPTCRQELDKRVVERLR